MGMKLLSSENIEASLCSKHIYLNSSTMASTAVGAVASVHATPQSVILETSNFLFN